MSGHPSRRSQTTSQRKRGSSPESQTRPMTTGGTGKMNQNQEKAKLHIHNDVQPFPEFENLDKAGVRALVEVQLPLGEVTSKNNNKNGRRVVGSTTHTTKNEALLDDENVDPLPQDTIDPNDPLGVKGVAHFYKDRREYREKLDIAIAKKKNKKKEEEERKLQQAIYERNEELIDEELVLMAEEQVRRRRESTREDVYWIVQPILKVKRLT